MTKARKHLIACLLAVSEGEFMTILTAGRQVGAGVAAQSLYVETTMARQRVSQLDWHGPLKSNTYPHATPPSTMPHLLILLKQFHQPGNKASQKNWGHSHSNHHHMCKLLHVFSQLWQLLSHRWTILPSPNMPRFTHSYVERHCSCFLYRQL